MLTWRAVRGAYDDARHRYFRDAEPPLRVPPPASELRWYWLPAGSPYLALTHFDDDWDPDSVGLNPWLGKEWSSLKVTLLHELTHMRDPRIGCGSATDSHAKFRGRPSPRWQEETVRLARLGAVLL